jgi:hypothetical protein
MEAGQCGTAKAVPFQGQLFSAACLALRVFAARSKTAFLAVPRRVGCPILRAVGEGWDVTAIHPRSFPAASAYPTLRRKREGWGTRSLGAGQERIRLYLSLSPQVLITLGEPQAQGDTAEDVPCLLHSVFSRALRRNGVLTPAQLICGWRVGRSRSCAGIRSFGRSGRWCGLRRRR